MRQHDWPGNLRELSHFAERTMPGMTPPPSPSHALSDAEALSLPERLEADIIRDTLATHGGNVQQTIAAALGISPKTVYDKLERHGIVRRDFEGE